MEFKLFGIIWDIRLLLIMIWCFVGMLIIGGVFWMPYIGYWNILYIFLAFVYIATAQLISDKLEDK